jgi:hypothetical protein
MAAIKIFKVTALPVTLEPHSMYLVAPAARPDFVEIYVTNNDATVVKRVVNTDDIQQMIVTAVQNNATISVVDNITARNNLSPTDGKLVLVIDASGDPTVTSGSATYVWRASTSTWIKISEYESMDVVIEWANIQNKPTSSVSDIDLAVAQRHTHANKTELDKVSEDTNSEFMYGGKYPLARLETADW